MKLILVVLCLGSLGPIGARDTRDITSLDPTALQVFLKPFREAVLHKVAVGWNHTITDSEQLKLDMQVCSNKIKDSVNKCKACTSAACAGEVPPSVVDSSPEFIDYLKFALSLLSPLTFLKDPLNEVGNHLGDLVDLLGDGSESFIDSMSDLGNSVGGKFTDIFHGLESSVNKVKDTLKDVGNTALSGIKDIGGSITDGISSGVSNAGHSLEHLGHSILHGIGVCGADVVRFNDTVRKNVQDIKGIFTAVSDKVNPVIVKLEYDPTSLAGSTFRKIFVTANIRGRYVRYQSMQSYDMINYVTSAHKIAEEFWTMWTV